ncbi:hydroxyacid dehydrogenase [Aneurinibacillus migulanus]|uniref:3-phosphoglycerate dehydrogenase n=1 Tax=Aneurinibacillus migulanus TaxID=47500 RepID=A0A0D1XVP7_ANEMI|nr:hydroxyacid dehydrogenase [Aneurinibacillus migulanus]KIV58261.1 3-phosphoglycerate dehydrogenase [Aneurinibacillus migulanus]KON96013.1 3-phosphoglycerate dehydrogenase [Aneurinibacillus migulanus]MED0896583.1 hydroxyacid dehydrogenase [Aneurinibacillus migulanus]MED1616476.1 hydroxyacid dehydrogenase [Aneurinibacillus migulanus]SDJ19945.1 D-3-phosphoglycerate dehydrogenase [Aneurinibacillus migulanus]
MNYTVYIPQDIEEEGKNYLLERGYKIKLGSGLAEEVLMEEINDCDAVLTRSNAMINRKVIQAGKKLKIIAKYGVGLDNIDIEEATQQGIYVTNTPQANANAVAEHVLALMFCLSKNLLLVDRELRTGNFAIRNQLYSMNLGGKTLGIIGLGRIGRLLADKARQGLGMKVVGYDPYVDATSNLSLEIVTDVEWLFKNADVISLHLPLTETTKGIIGKREFLWMKSSAYLINASRGGVVKEDDLIQVLREGRIAGAGIDVFEMEPPDKRNPLFELDNVIVTPHNAALTKEASICMAMDAAIQIDQVLSGRKPDWSVNEPLIKKVFL